MKKIFTILLLFFHFSSGWTQIVDIYHNKKYSISTDFLEIESDKDYTPAKIEINQDKNNDKNELWSKIEEQLNDIAIENIENEIAFFQILKQAGFEEEIDEYEQHHSSQYRLKNIEIQLLSVINNFGVYAIQYNFETGSYNSTDKYPAIKYYLADYKNNKVQELGTASDLRQQKELEKSIIPKLERIYTLQTQKWDLDNVEKMKTIENEGKKEIDFANKIHFSEAIVYPYFSGLVVEFPAYSSSSQIFNNEPFRFFFKGDELAKLISVFPLFQPLFQQRLNLPSHTQMETLNNDDNFDYSRFYFAPKELKVLPLLNSDNELRTMKIEHYQIIQDTVKYFSGSKIFYFNENQQIVLEEWWEPKDILRGEEKYSYNNKNQLTGMKSLGRYEELALYHYENDILSYIENMRRDIKNEEDDVEEVVVMEEEVVEEIEEDDDVAEDDYYEAYEDWYDESDKKSIDLEISQQHIVYNKNYKYTFKFYLTGTNRTGDFQIRYINENQYCTNDFCFILNENKQVIGIKQKRDAPVDILTNSKGQPVESYFDNDRQNYFFEYDNKDRVIAINFYRDGKLNNSTKYYYQQDSSTPLIITESAGKLRYEYYLEFWE